MSKKEEGHSTVKIKIVSLGEVRVGKSCLIRRFCEGSKFSSQYYPTIGLDNYAKQLTIDGTPVYTHFWDMSGDDSYFEVRNEFYNDTDGFIIVFDLSSRETFTQLSRWIDEAKRYGADLSSSILCGNKCDSSKISVSNDEASSFARKLGIPYFDTSARSGKNIPDAFIEKIQTSKKQIIKLIFLYFYYDLNKLL